MGIFSKKNDEVKKEAVKAVKPVAKPAKAKAPKVAKSPKAEKSSTSVAVVSANSSNINENNRVILGPRITEKATEKADKENVFVFEITQDATKLNVRKAIAAIYKVIPVKVSIARNPSKTVFSRGRMGVHSGVKKAYVYLKKGDKIEIV